MFSAQKNIVLTVSLHRVPSCFVCLLLVQCPVKTDNYFCTSLSRDLTRKGLVSKVDPPLAIAELTVLGKRSPMSFWGTFTVQDYLILKVCELVTKNAKSTRSTGHHKGSIYIFIYYICYTATVFQIFAPCHVK